MPDGMGRRILVVEDEMLIAAELEAEAARKAEAGEDEEPAEETDEDGAPKRRRGRRGGRGRARTKKASSYEATFEHGDEGYGLWLDPAVADDGVYAEHWAGHRQVEVTIEADQIVIKRVGGDADAEGDAADGDAED